MKINLLKRREKRVPTYVIMELIMHSIATSHLQLINGVMSHTLAYSACSYS